MIKFLFWFALFIGLVCYSFYKYNQIDLYRKHRRQHEDVDRTVSMTFENFEKFFAVNGSDGVGVLVIIARAILMS